MKDNNADHSNENRHIRIIVNSDMMIYYKKKH